LKIEAAFATLPLPGESESGDLCLIKRVGKGTLIAVVDGLGHGQEAASAAHAAVGALDRYSREPLIELVRRSHDALVGLRGVVLGLAYLDPHAATMAWLGVGNVGGVLLRADVGNRPSRITLVPNAGFIGAEPARPTTRSVPLASGRYRDSVFRRHQRRVRRVARALQFAAGDRRLGHHPHVKGNDDALVLVARYVR